MVSADQVFWRLFAKVCNLVLDMCINGRFSGPVCILIDPYTGETGQAIRQLSERGAAIKLRNSGANPGCECEAKRFVMLHSLGPKGDVSSKYLIFCFDVK